MTGRNRHNFSPLVLPRSCTASRLQLRAEVSVEKRAGRLVQSRTRMSEIGPPKLRAKPCMSDLCGKTHNKQMHNIYDELRLWANLQ